MKLVIGLLSGASECSASSGFVSLGRFESMDWRTP